MNTVIEIILVLTAIYADGTQEVIAFEPQDSINTCLVVAGYMGGTFDDSGYISMALTINDDGDLYYEMTDGENSVRFACTANVTETQS